MSRAGVTPSGQRAGRASRPGFIFDPYEPATPDTNGEPPPTPMPDEPDIPNDPWGW